MDAISKSPLQDIRKLGEILMRRTSEKEYYRFLHIEEQCRLKWQTSIDKFDKLMKEHERYKLIKTELENDLQHVSVMWKKEKEARQLAETRCALLVDKLEQTYDFLRYSRDIENVQVKNRAKAQIGGRNASRNSDEITSTGSFLSNLSAISGTETETDFLGTSAGILIDSFHDDLPDSMGSDELDEMLSQPASLLEQTFRVTSNPDQVYIDAGEYNISSYDASDLMVHNTLKRSNKYLHVSNDFTKANLSVACRKQKENALDQINSDPIYEKINGDYDSDDENKENSTMVNGVTDRRMSTLHQDDLASKIQDPLIGCQHTFSRRTASRSDVCVHCSKKFLFGILAYKCSKCKSFFHHDCKSQLKSSSKGRKSGKGMHSLNISNFVPAYGPSVPGLIMHCVDEVETRGLSERGIYRVSGSEREIKALKERFLYDDFPDLSTVDIHVICGCIKIFLRGLSEPLIPTRQWNTFSNAVVDFDGDYLAGNIMRNLQIEIERLPKANRDTLAFLVLHLQRVATCPAVQMPISNLAKIFGPTVVGYSQKEPDHRTILGETIIQQSVMEHFLNIPTDYWFSFINTNISFDA